MGNQVPRADLASMEALFARPSGQGQEALTEMTEKMQKVVRRGLELEQQYAGAPNLYEVRLRMLLAARLLAHQLKKDEASRARLVRIASRIMGSPAPAQAKLEADRILTTQKLLAAPAANPDKVPQLIHDLVERYKGTDAERNAIAYGAILAANTDQERLKAEYCQRLEDEHGGDPRIHGLLRALGRHPDVGQPFTAKLMDLDGGRLTLPDDLLGKVVVIDFWATWCQPCLAEVPHLKELYAEYKPKGVEIVSINIEQETTRDQLSEFVRRREMNWVQAYKGQSTAQVYGIQAIPSYWVIGKDGAILSDNARGRLEELIEQGLEAPSPTTQKQ